MNSSHIHLHPGDNLQKALDQASPGDILELSEGVYRAKCTINVPSITIRGAGMNRTKIVWDDYAKKIHADGKEYVTFRTFTLAVCAGCAAAGDQRTGSRSDRLRR